MNSEGYCGTCHFMVDLSDEGRMLHHGSRLRSEGLGRTPACPGTGRFPDPAPATPEIKEIAFRDAPPPGCCGVCGKKPPVTDGLWARHAADDGNSFCRGSYQPAD